MIPSSEAQFYLESGQDIYSHTKLVGKTIAIVLFPTSQDDEENIESTDRTSYAYICSVGSDRGYHLRPSFVAGNCGLVLRFSTATKVKLNTSNLDEPLHALDQNLQLLQNVLGNVKIKSEYFVSNSCEDNRTIYNIEKNAGCKILDAKYCMVETVTPEITKEVIDEYGKGIHGCVYSISVNDENRFMELNPFPLPLLSISLVQTGGRQITSENDSERSTLDILLQQCLKRLLVNQLVLCPVSNISHESSGSPSQGLIEDDYSSQKRDLNDHGRSLVSLTVPSLKGSAETFIYKVLDVLPQLNTTMGTKWKLLSNIFLILPSTRITLIQSRNEKIGAATALPSIAKFVQKPSTMDLILSTINSIRHVSKLRYKKQTSASHCIDIPRAFIISGPPGTGKTYAVRMAVDAANAQKGTLATRLISIRGSEILSSGHSEADAALELRKVFLGALEFASKNPENISVIFMDECDALLSSDIAGATVAALFDQMSSNIYEEEAMKSNHVEPGSWKRVLVMAATNRIDAIPSSLRRPGRIDREISISPPNTKERLNILKSLLQDMENPPLNSDSSPETITDQELLKIAELCVGYVASDLASLIRKATFLSTKKGVTNMTYALFREAMKDVGASALRDSAINAPPSTRWDDIAGDAGGAKTALRRAVEWPQTKKKEFEMLGLVPPRGILLHGPPGCAKTTLARAAAGAAGIAFLSLSPADVYASSYVGEAEAVVRRAFSLARSASPCVLFFDEIDSIVAASSSNKSGMDRNNSAEARVLSTFLNEMDGVDGSISDGVLVLGATNRPSTLDSALIRPGRFDKVIYVPNPDEKGRQMILRSQCQKWGKNAATDINIETLSSEKISGMMTGAEIVGACKEAAMLAIREHNLEENSNRDNRALSVQQRHLEKTLGAVAPLLSDPSVLSEYTSFDKKYT